jgi:hypothetical protein
MIHAYSDLYLSDARRTLASSFNAAVYTYGLTLPQYYSFFIDSDYSKKFEKGNPFIISGMSGIELAANVIESCSENGVDTEPVFMDDRSPEYWVGWALAYYQWCYACSFKKLNEEVPIETIIKMYPKYHEMDISQFADKLNTLRMSSTKY